MIRLLLAWAVVVSHAPVSPAGTRWWQSVGGPPAVELFFVISGFYIALILDQKYRRGQTAATTFWASRFWRLWPAYALIALATIAYHALGSLHRAEPWHVLSAAPNVGELSLRAKIFWAFSQLTFLGQDWYPLTAFENGRLFLANKPSHWTIVGSHFLIVPPAWSLGSEVAFYLLAPWLLRLRTGWLVAITLVTTAGKIGGYKLFDLPYEIWGTRFFPFALPCFLLGALAYRWFPSRRTTSRAALAWPIGWLAILLFTHDTDLPFWLHTLRWIAFALSVPAIFACTRDWKWDRWIGEISYPLYIGHFLVLAILEAHTGLPLPAQALVCVALAVAMQVGLLQTIETWRQAWVSSTVAFSIADRSATP